MATTRRRKPDQKFVMISVVAERYAIHPQTLRLYEREGLIQAGSQRRQHPPLPRRGGDPPAGDHPHPSPATSASTSPASRSSSTCASRWSGCRAKVDRLLEFVKRMAEERRADPERQHALVRLHSGPLSKVR